jgi:5-methylcytosine-specific restriction endonuclease McrA
MKLRKYTERQLADAVKSSTSLAQTLSKLNVAPYGGNYEVLRKAIRHFSIDTSHFTGQAWSRGKTFGAKQPLKRYLDNDLQIQSYKLKNRLLADGLLSRVCSSCKRTKWLGQHIPLELDHINGNRHDNRLINLRLLCPNCHALTPTYRAKNRASKLSSVLPSA